MIGAIIIGLFAGAVAKILMPGKNPGGFVITILLGLAGALLGFFLFTELLGIGESSTFDLGGLLGAIVGAVILLALPHMAPGEKRERNRPAPMPGEFKYPNRNT
jgi:uncharacterized membrane protein YeaQ/YmgE (transglycosylase-associated protein family)